MGPSRVQGLELIELADTHGAGSLERTVLEPGSGSDAEVESVCLSVNFAQILTIILGIRGKKKRKKTSLFSSKTGKSKKNDVVPGVMSPALPDLLFLVLCIN